MVHRLMLLTLLGLFVTACSDDGPEQDGATVLGAIFHDGISESARLRLDAVRMAVEQINAAGALTAPLKVVNLSPALGDAADPKRAADKARLLHDQHEAVAVVSLFSALGQSIIKVTNSSGYSDLVQCNCSASNPELNLPGKANADRNDTFYRTVPTDSFQGKLMAKLMQDSGWTKVGIYSLDDSFGRGLRQVLLSEVASLGGVSVASDATHPEGQFDLDKNRPALDKFVSLSVAGQLEVVVLATLKSQAPHIIKYLTEKGYKGGLLLSDGAKTNEVFKIATGIDKWVGGKNLLIGTEPDNYAGKNSSAFTAAFRARFGAEPNTYSSTAYDCAVAVGLALLYAGKAAPTAADVKAKMPLLKSASIPASAKTAGIGSAGFSAASTTISGGGKVKLEGAAGTLIFDENGDRPSQSMRTFEPNATMDGWQVKDRYDEQLNLVK